MQEYLMLEGLALAVAFGLGFLAGRHYKTEKVKIPDYVPEEWKIGKEGQ